VGYIKETVKGVSWVGAYRISNRLLTVLKTAILARLLLPVQFGIFGIAMLALGFLEIMTETGINVFLVQEKSEIKEYLDTAWIVSIGRGILVTIFLLLMSPLISKFFNSPESLPVLLVVSIVPFVRGFINPAEARFQKELLFNKEFWFRLGCLILDTSVAIILALITRSVFAMVWGMVAGVILELILSWLVLTPRPKLSFEKEKAKRIIDRGKWMTGASIFNYLFQNGDNMTIGKLLGEGPLGIYNVAYKISSLPISEISDVVSKVTFPVYSRISTDYERLKKAFLKTTLVTGLLIILAGIGIYVLAEQIVSIVLGPNWSAAVPILKVLSIFGIIKGASFSPLSLFLAVGKQEYVTYVTLLGIAGLFIPIIPLTLKYGLMGTGYSVIIGSLVTIPLIIYYIIKIFRKLKYEK
jgi:lipopolysaccharide exporter